MPSQYDVIILGAGASGLFAAAAALKNGRGVAVIEHNPSPLAKVKISGGGFCNFTNTAASPEFYCSQNPHFCRSALKQFPPESLLALAEKHALCHYQKTPGRFFCADGSAAFIKMLMQEAAAAKFYYNTVFKLISARPNHFVIQTAGQELCCRSLIIALGAPSYPGLGATDDGFKLAKSLGHKIIPARPALVPFNLDSALQKRLRPLQGISLPAAVTVNGRLFRDDLLFTHFGLSGPVILQASLYWQKNQPLILNLLPEVDLFTYLKKQQTGSKIKVLSVLRSLLPDRMADCFAAPYNLKLAEMSNNALHSLAESINRWTITPAGTRGYTLAEVTAGGVDTAFVSSSAMESAVLPGLFFCGEVLDVTGQLGGFNLQWAYASGSLAGSHA